MVIAIQIFHNSENTGESNHFCIEERFPLILTYLRYTYIYLNKYTFLLTNYFFSLKYQDRYYFIVCVQMLINLVYSDLHLNIHSLFLLSGYKLTS